MSSISSIYNSLTAQQKQFVNEKTISATLRIEKWLRFLGKMVKYDHKIDQQISLMGTLMVIGWVGVVLTLIVAGVAENIMIAVGIIPFLLLAILTMVRQSNLKSKDIDNYLRLFFIPILSILKEKAGKDAKLSASLDFRIPRKALKPIESRVRGRKLKLYEPKYIACRVLLKDGVSLEFAVKDDIKDYRWTKTSASGKIKSKSKTKVTHHCFLKMTLPKSDYELKNLPPNEIVLEENDTSYVMKKKLKIKVIGKDKVLSPKKVFGEIQLIYNCFLSFRLGDESATPPIPQPEKNQNKAHDDEDDYMTLGPMVWGGDLFDRYDYDNFDYADSSEFMVDDDSITVFDS